MIIYQMMAIEMEPWALKMINKPRRGFLWVGNDEVQGGNYLVAWPTDYHPKVLGGLGYHNLRWLSAAIDTRWMW